MKLRIKGNSLRLRLTRTDLETLLRSGRVEDAISFGADPGARLVYALEHREDQAQAAAQFQAQEITVRLPSQAARQWQASGQIGIYANLPVGAQGNLELILEKDFACLDRSDADNADTFPHPNAPLSADRPARLSGCGPGWQTPAETASTPRTRLGQNSFSRPYRDIDSGKNI